MKRLVSYTVALAVAFTVTVSGAQDLGSKRTLPDTRALTSRVANQQDPTAFGRPLSYWLERLHNRDPEAYIAVAAIVELGPDAKAAIPELTQIIAEPFVPIQPGKDSRDEIRTKLLNIDLRAGAVDGLGAIGKVAAGSADTVIRWGLTLRVVAPVERSSSTDTLFIRLIGIDVVERMRAAGTVAQFGLDAFPSIQELIESDDNEKLKFAAAILNEDTLLAAAILMQREDCISRIRGLSLLGGMWPVVAVEHLEALKEVLKCTENENRKRIPASKLRSHDE
jgi:hypothetical protein